MCECPVMFTSIVNQLGCVRSLGAGVPSTPLRLLPSPLRPANQHMLQTPSPVRLGASSFFATPGGLFPGTPVTEAMAAAGWLQDLSARSPSEVRAAGKPPYVLLLFRGC